MTDQTLGLPQEGLDLPGCAPTAAQLLRRIELRPTTSWAVAALIAAGPDAAFLGRRRHVPQHSLHRGRDAGAGRLRGAADAPGAVRDRAGRLAGRADRGRLLGQARGHEHGRARLRPLLLSELLVDDQLSVERPAPLPRGSRRCAARRGGSLAWLAYRADGTRVPRRWAALALPLFACCSPGTAPTPRASAGTCSSTIENLYVSSFYASWGETLEALWRGALLEAAPRAAAAAPAFTHSDVVQCRRPSRRTSS